MNVSVYWFPENVLWNFAVSVCSRVITSSAGSTGPAGAAGAAGAAGSPGFATYGRIHFKVFSKILEITQTECISLR